MTTNENPTIEEAMEQASGTLTKSVEEAPSTEQEASTEVEEVVEDTTTETETEEDVAQANEEETPVDKVVDPNELPEELKPLYEKMKKDMDKGFTQGRQKDRAEINELRKELTKLKKQSDPTEEDLSKLTPEEQIERLAEQKVLQSKIKDFREQALQDYNNLDPRLDNSEGNDSYDEVMDTAISTQLDKLLADHVEIHGNELGFDYKAKSKELIENWDSYIRSKTDSYIAKQREQAKKSEQKISKANPKTKASSVKPNSTMSLEDAVNAAFNRIK